MSEVSTSNVLVVS